jgi:hypothetical protein
MGAYSSPGDRLSVNAPRGWYKRPRRPSQSAIAFRDRRPEDIVMTNPGIETRSGPSPHPYERGSAEGGVKARLLDELRKALLIALYLWLFLAAFRLYRSVILDDDWRDYWGQGFAVFNALVLAKVIVIGDMLKVGPRLEDSRRIWFVLSQALVFALLLVVFHLAEEVLKGAFHGHGLEAGRELLEGRNLRAAMAGAAVFFLVLIPFFGFRELVRTFGEAPVTRALMERGAQTQDVRATG